MKAALVALALALAVPAGARAADACATDPVLLESPYRLERVARQLAAGGTLRIVAFGSSSTEGLGASDASRTYPAQLERALGALFPRATVTVANRGVSGQDSRQMLKRLDADVLAEWPDLVVWQTGTNSAIQDQSVGEYLDDVVEGVRRMRAVGADVLVMGPQKSPRMDLATHRLAFAEHLRAAADLTQAPYFARYEVMAGWLARGQMTMDAMIDPDGLHMTDLSYGCLAAAVADMIANLARAPVARP